MISLRLRVACVVAGVILTLLTIGGLLIGSHIAADLDHTFDSSTRERLHSAATGLEFEHGGVERHGQGPDVIGFALVDSNRERIAGDAWLNPPAGLDAEGTMVLGIAHADDGTHCRTAWMRMVPESDEQRPSRPIDVGIAISMEPLIEQQTAIRQVLIIGALAVAAATILLLSLALGRMLAPHARLAVLVGQLDPRRPGARLETGDLPPELRSIALRINELCDRLERAYGLASSFHASAAHELRTPLAGLRATIEVAQQPSGDPAAALATCHDIALQMQSRIDNLLMAARIDAGKLTPRREEIDVHSQVRASWEIMSERASARGLVATWDLQGSGLAYADPEAVRMVLTNLIDNVVSHADAMTPVTIACRDSGDRLVLTISNQAGSMSDEAVSKVFERGWRSAQGAGDIRHAGLGMGITRELVGLMSGRIEARLVAQVFSIELSLPAPGVFEYW